MLSYQQIFCNSAKKICQKALKCSCLSGLSNTQQKMTIKAQEKICHAQLCASCKSFSCGQGSVNQFCAMRKLMEQWKVFPAPERTFFLPLPEECQVWLQGQEFHWAKMKCQSRNPNLMTGLMLFPPSPFFFCCLPPHAHLEAPNMASFEDCFSCSPCCPVSTPISHL